MTAHLVALAGPPPSDAPVAAPASEVLPEWKVVAFGVGALLGFFLGRRYF